MALLVPIAILSSLTVGLQPAMAMVSHPFSTSPTLGAMSNRMDAAAKNAEGKLQSATGEITGNPGQQIKGKAKQVQGSAMNVAEDVKEGAQAAGKKLADATGQN